MRIALSCTNCSAVSVSSFFYQGPDAHVCRACGAAFELADPAHDRRLGGERRMGGNDAEFAAADWRSGFDRRAGAAA